MSVSLEIVKEAIRKKNAHTHNSKRNRDKNHVYHTISTKLKTLELKRIDMFSK